MPGLSIELAFLGYGVLKQSAMLSTAAHAVWFTVPSTEVQLSHAVWSAAEAHKTVLQRAKGIKTPMHMLAAIPLIMTALRDDADGLVKRAADVALRAIELNCADWHNMLQR